MKLFIVLTNLLAGVFNIVLYINIKNPMNLIASIFSLLIALSFAYLLD